MVGDGFLGIAEQQPHGPAIQSHGESQQFKVGDGAARVLDAVDVTPIRYPGPAGRLSQTGAELVLAEAKRGPPLRDAPANPVKSPVYGPKPCEASRHVCHPVIV